MNNRTSMAQRDEIIKRTVYVSDIDQQVRSCIWLWYYLPHLDFLCLHCCLYADFGIIVSM
jgi:hypothetical protein